MARAVFDGVVVAESDDVRVVEGMTYFPIESVDMNVLVESPATSRCVWKGKATYWHVRGRTDVAPNAAFTYRRPWPLAFNIMSIPTVIVFDQAGHEIDREIGLPDRRRLVHLARHAASMADATNREGVA